MVNKKNSGKLDELIKQTLSNYEASSNSSDWAQMEKIVDTFPRSSSFRYKLKVLSILESLKAITRSKSVKRVFSPYVLVGLLLLVGAYFLYRILNTPNTLENTTNSSPQNNIITDTIQALPPAVVSKDIIKKENKTEQLKETVSSSLVTNDKSLVLTEEAEPVKKDNILKKEEDKKLADAKADILKKLMKTEQEMNKDTSGKVSGVSKENNEFKKEEKDQSVISIGRDNFLLYTNSDSLKKFQNQQSQDTVKGPD